MTISAARGFVAAGRAFTMHSDGDGWHEGVDFVGTRAALAMIQDPDNNNATDTDREEDL